MRTSGRCACLSIAAALLASAAATAQPVPADPAGTPTVKLRLNPDLGDALPHVRAALLGQKAVRIAEPADYEITTKKHFPLTLIAFDAKQPPADWANDFTADPVRPAPRTAELGNFALDDFSGRLRELIDRRDRANLLLAAGSTQAGAERTEIETCLVAAMDPEAWENCHRGPVRLLPDGLTTPDLVDGQTVLVASVRNRSARPYYIAVLAIDPAFGITRLPLKDGGDNSPLKPGARSDGDVMLGFGQSSGLVVLVTIASERPIDTGAIEQQPFDELGRDECPANSACTRKPFAIPDDWQITLAEYRYEPPLKVGIGGGLDVAEGMAPWMAEIYSTRPFTPKEIADDSRAPEGKRKFLAQRSKAERDHRCGGALIGTNLLITAAHCVANDPFTPTTMAAVLTDRRVRVDSKRLGKGGSTLAIAGLAVPANYTPGKQENDIALLLLKADRDTKRYDEPAIRIGEKPIAAGTDVTAFGWGYTGVVAPGANPLLNIAEELQRNPDQLQFGQMRALGWGACRKRLKQRLGPGMVCVVAPGAETGGVPDKNVFSCRGDSGGPLIRKVGDVEELVGVTSWSLGCGYKDIPSVYTDVTKYRRWIAAAMQKLRPGFALPVDEKAAPSRKEGRRQ